MFKIKTNITKNHNIVIQDYNPYHRMALNVGIRNMGHKTHNTTQVDQQK